MIFNFIIGGDAPNTQHQVRADSLKEAMQQLEKELGKVEIIGWRRIE